MKKFRFRDDGLAGDIFYSEKGRSRSAGLFLFGLPAFPGPNDVTRSLVSNGVLAFQPHYCGTYDSDGEFSPSSIIDTCRMTQRFFDLGAVTNIKNNKAFPLPKLEICVGHSFGTFAALRSIHLLSDIRLLVLLAPTAHYHADFGNKAEGMASLNYIRCANPYTYRLAPDEAWLEMMSGREPLPTTDRHPRLEKVIAVVGENDNYVDIPAFQKSYDRLIDAYCGSEVPREMRVIPQGGHTMDYLVETENFSLLALLQEYGLSSTRSD